MRNIRIDAAAFLWSAVMILILPLRWLLAAFLAAMFHELCHYLALRMVGCRPLSFTFRSTGAVMEIPPLSPGKELFCALAGPVGGLLLICFSRYMPMVALCALAQNLFNLLPIYPLDGGRALRCVVMLLHPGKSVDPLCKRVSALCIGVLTLFTALLLLRYQLGAVPVLSLAVLWMRALPRKIPCKTASQRLQ